MPTLLDYVLAQSHHVATVFFPNLSYMHPSSTPSLTPWPQSGVTLACLSFVESFGSVFRGNVGSGLPILRLFFALCASSWVHVISVTQRPPADTVTQRPSARDLVTAWMQLRLDRSMDALAT